MDIIDSSNLRESEDLKMNSELNRGYVARTKSPRKNSVAESIRLGSGAFEYELRLSFFHLPAQLSNNVISGVCRVGGFFVLSTYSKDYPLALFDESGSFVRFVKCPVDIIHAHSCSATGSNTFLLTDSSAHAVYELSLGGELIHTFGNPGKASDSGIDPVAWEIDRNNAYLSIQRAAEPFCFPTKAIQGKDCRYYVSDGHGNAAVHIFSDKGELLSSFGGPGWESGNFNTPHSICLVDDLLCIADRDNDRVSFFDLDGSFKSEICGLLHPVDVSFKDGYLYVAEKDGRISIFDGSHEIVGQIGYCGSPFAASSLFVDYDGSIFITLCRKPYPVVKLEVIR